MISLYSVNTVSGAFPAEGGVDTSAVQQEKHKKPLQNLHCAKMNPFHQCV